MIVIVDYGMGNLLSIRNMIKKVGGQAEITGDHNKILAAKALILPGVGHFGKAMSRIKTLKIDEVLNEKVIQQSTPILGICLGMQLLMEHSEEGDADGLSWINGTVKKFRFSDSDLKVPHIGWTDIHPVKNQLFNGLEDEARFYFVHSYYVQCRNSEDVLATVNYGFDFHCAVNRKNIFGTQFHPEKSHKYGMKLFSNFLEICNK